MQVSIIDSIVTDEFGILDEFTAFNRVSATGTFRATGEPRSVR